MAEIFLTREGKEEKEKYLEYLTSVRRPEVISKLKAAREYGDLSENAEYDAARDEQGKLETEINLIEETLKLAHIVDKNNIRKDEIAFGAKVKLLDMEYDEEVEYSIVGSIESNPNLGLISDQSPIGKSLLGKKVGDIVLVAAPGGAIKMKVIKIG